MRAAIHLAQTVGARLGRCEVLQRPLQGQAKNLINLRRDFQDRDDLFDYLAGGILSPFRGGRDAADELLRSFRHAITLFPAIS